MDGWNVVRLVGRYFDPALADGWWSIDWAWDSVPVGGDVGRSRATRAYAPITSFSS